MSSVVRTILKKKSIFLVLLFAVAGFVFSASPARAFSGWSLLSFGEATIADILYSIIVRLLVGILAIMGKLVNYALQPWTLIDSAFVQAGWTAMRDLGNMLFIIVLLGIALDYILFNSVGVKRALPRLLLIALLVNFSLPIAGVFLDFANVFTTFFIEKASAGGGFSEALGARLGLSNLFHMSDPESLATATQAGSGTLSTVLFAIIFLSGTIFVFLLLAILFFIRHLYLSVLLIVLPLVLIASALPFLSSHFKKWSNKFFQWTMFAPAAAFFLYLSMVFLGSSQVGAITKAMSGSGSVWFETTGSQAATFIFAWLLMTMSLTVGQSMGIAGASIAVSTFQKGTKWARGKALNATKRTATATGRAIGADKQLESLARGLQKLPGGGVLSSGVRGMAAKTKAAIEKQEALTAAEKTKFEGLSDEALLDEYNTYLNSSIPGDKAKGSAIAVMLSQRKGNALTIKNPDGSVNEEETVKLRKAAYNNAKAHSNKAAMDVLTEKDPRIKMHAIEQKYKGRDPKDKIDGKTRIEAERDYYKNIKAKDIAELPDSFFTTKEGKALVFEMMTAKSLTSFHLRTALDEQKHEFLNRVGDFIKAIDGIGTPEIKAVPAKGKKPAMAAAAATGLYAQNFSLAKYLTGDAGGEVAGLVL